MSWILFTLLAVLVWSVVNIIDKHVLSRWVRRPEVVLLILAIASLIVGSVILFFRGLDIPFNIILFCLFGGVLYALALVFYFRAAKIEEISRVIPILYLTPLFVAIIAFVFLAESLSVFQYFAVLFLILGALLITYKKGFRLNSAFWLTVLSALVMAFYEIVMKFVLGLADFWSVFALFRIGTFVGVLPLFFFFWDDLRSAVIKRTPVFLIILAVLGNILGVFFITLAISSGYVTLVSGLTAVQPFVVFLLTILLSVFFPSVLRERISGRILLLKTLAIGLIVAGVLLLI